MDPITLKEWEDREHERQEDLEKKGLFILKSKVSPEEWAKLEFQAKLYPNMYIEYYDQNGETEAIEIIPDENND